MKKGTGLLGWAITVLSVVLIIAALPTEKEVAIYADTIRLHILANSNGEEDQALKLEVRDKILEKYGTALSAYNDKSAAEENIRALEGSIENDVNAWVSEAGYSYESDVSLLTEWYDTRVYEDYTLPCGYYTSLSVRLGEAEGKNWWCVMFPPLCLDVATSESEPADSGYTKEEERLIEGGGYNIKFKILELFAESFK